MLALAVGAVAGDLQPPAGPVQPTMRTLDEVFAAAGSGGGSGCGEAIPGMERGTCEIIAPNLSATNSIAYEVEIDLSRTPPQPGGSIGPLVAAPVKYRKEQDRNSPLIAQRLAVGSALQSLRVVYRDSSGTPYYEVEFHDVRFTGLKPEATARCDGSYAHTEVVSFVWVTAEFMDLDSGTSYTVNSQGGPAAAE